jgi:hypothetical protein
MGQKCRLTVVASAVSRARAIVEKVFNKQLRLPLAFGTPICWRQASRIEL